MGYYLKKEKILKLSMRNDGYQVVGLYIENISKNDLYSGSDPRQTEIPGVGSSDGHSFCRCLFACI